MLNNFINLIKRLFLLNNSLIKDDSFSAIEALRLKFKIKVIVYGFMFWVLSVVLLLITLTLGVLSALIYVRVFTSSENYSLSVLIVGAITSFISSLLSFFLLKNKYFKNQSLYTFILLEKIAYKNNIGIYASDDDPKMLLYLRICQRLGVHSILIEEKQEIN